MSTFSNDPWVMFVQKVMLVNGFRPTLGRVAGCDKFIIGSMDIIAKNDVPSSFRLY